MLDSGSTCLPLDDPNNLWKYCGSIPAAAIFFTLFGLSTILHILQAVKYRKVFCWTIIMGGAWESISYVIRILSIRNPTKRGYYDLSLLMILLAPLWINAFDYMLQGRMVHFFLPQQRLFGIKAQMMGMLFVSLDVMSFIIQVIGAGLAINKNEHTSQIGFNIYTGGVALQQLFILCFAILTIRLGRKLREGVSPQSNVHHGRVLLHVLHASLALISFRIIFRIVEFSAGAGSPVATTINHHEYFVYIFDAVPMFLALLLMNIWHPGAVLVGPESEFSRRAPLEKRVRTQQGRHTRQRRVHENADSVELV